MTRKDYTNIANVCKQQLENTGYTHNDDLIVRDFIHELANSLEANNKNFNKQKFLDYIYS